MPACHQCSTTSQLLSAYHHRTTLLLALYFPVPGGPLCGIGLGQISGVFCMILDLVGCVSVQELGALLRTVCVELQVQSSMQQLAAVVKLFAPCFLTGRARDARNMRLTLALLSNAQMGTAACLCNKAHSKREKVLVKPALQDVV